MLDFGLDFPNLGNKLSDTMCSRLLYHLEFDTENLHSEYHWETTELLLNSSIVQCLSEIDDMFDR